MKDALSIKIWKETRTKLRLLHVLTNESMIAIIDRLATRELERLRSIPDDEISDRLLAERLTDTILWHHPRARLKPQEE